MVIASVLYIESEAKFIGGGARSKKKVTDRGEGESNIITMSGHRKKGNRVKFFQVPPFYYLPIIISGMSLTTIMTIAPEVLPYESMWFIGRFLHAMAYDYYPITLIICCAAWVAHFFEAALAFRISRKLRLTDSDTIKWTIQTFVLGFPSLGILRRKLNHQKHVP